MKRKSLLALMLVIVMALTVLMVACNSPIEAPKTDTIEVTFSKDATLSSVKVPEGFSWKNKDEKIKYGTHGYAAVYTKDDKSVDTTLVVKTNPTATMLDEEASMDYVEKTLASDAFKKGGAMYEDSIYDKYVMILARSYRGVKADIKANYMARLKDIIATEGSLDKTTNIIKKLDFNTNAVMTLLALKESTVVDDVDLAAPFYDKANVEANVFGSFTYTMRIVKNITIPETYKTADGVEHTSTTTLDSMIAYMVGLANANGGWYMEDFYTKEQVLDVDTTINAINGLADFYDRAEVKAVIDKAVDVIKAKQIASGSIDNWGDNISTTGAMISAVSALGMDASAIKNAESGKSLFDFADTMRIKDGDAIGAYTSAFADPAGSADNFSNNDMFTALVSYNRYLRGDANFFNISIK